jgi:uncharacterized protein YlzI (FlbEa/FlbD family)
MRSDKFVELTPHKGCETAGHQYYCLNPDHITAIIPLKTDSYKHNEWTQIMLTNGLILDVQEDINSVYNLIDNLP